MLDAIFDFSHDFSFRGQICLFLANDYERERNIYELAVDDKVLLGAFRLTGLNPRT